MKHDARSFPCPQCGAEDWELLGPSNPIAAVWPWLLRGPAGLEHEARCRRCGSRQAAFATAMLGRPRTLRLIGLVRALGRARSAQPVPLAYVLAFGLGALLGAALDDLTWYAGGLLVTAIVWIVFASSVFWGSRARHRPSLRQAIAWQVAPQRAFARDDLAQAERFRRTRLPLYGLPPSYGGSRWIGGWGGHDDAGMSSATLAHGDPEGACLRVEVTLSQRAIDLSHFVGGLAHHAALDSLPPVPDMGTLVRKTNEILHARSGVAPVSAAIDVDGSPVPFSMISEGRFWVAVAAVGDVHLVVHGERFPIEDVALVRISDVEPYVAGMRAMRQRRG